MMKTSLTLSLALGAILLSGACRAAEPNWKGDTAVEQGLKDGSFKRAIFAGGCFWCMQPPYDKLDGVQSTTVGYTGGDKPDPSYEEVCSGLSGHLEAVEVVYDPKKVSYEELLEVFWRSMDPTDAGGQFADRGPQYAPAIFVFDEEQRKAAEKSKKDLQASGRFDRPIVVPIEDAKPFYPAEGYHQFYYKKKPERYQPYRVGSGREDFLQRSWPDKKTKP